MRRPARATLLALTLAAPAAAQNVPTEIGQCVKTAIAEVGSRLEGVPDSGDALSYENGLYGISYSDIPGLEGAQAGDPVKLCLVSLPEGCPPGDDRGKVYAAHNARTGLDWELPDAGHMCGGA